MTSLNRVLLAGNLTREPDLRRTSNGNAVCDMRLAINDAYVNRSGERVETTCFTDVVAWAGQAESCGKFLAKGSPILVEGHLKTEEWETDAGEKRSKLRVYANRVQFLPRGRPAENNETGPTEPAAPEPSKDKDEISVPF